MLKGEKHDLVIQKATELGAAAIVNVACQRSIPALSGERADKRQLRWGRVAAAAAQQCRRPGCRASAHRLGWRQRWPSYRPGRGSCCRRAWRRPADALGAGLRRRNERAGTTPE